MNGETVNGETVNGETVNGEAGLPVLAWCWWKWHLAVAAQR